MEPIISSSPEMRDPDPLGWWVAVLLSAGAVADADGSPDGEAEADGADVGAVVADAVGVAAGGGVEVPPPSLFEPAAGGALAVTVATDAVQTPPAESWTVSETVNVPLAYECEPEAPVPLPPSP